MCSNLEAVNDDLKAVGALPQDDVDQRSAARAPIRPDGQSKTAEQEMIPSKKRKTRRGRNKRRHPYLNRDTKPSNNVKPEAPHNSNQFLIEDQGNSKEIDEQLRNDKGLTRTRDSSFSMDSDADFYSSPDDEEAFLRKDFDDTYENLRAERLNLMSKNELIEEFLQLEKRLDFLTKRVKSKYGDIDDEEEEKSTAVNAEEFQKEIERLLIENETLKRENSDLRNKMPVSHSDSKDSESDSSETCSSCSSSGSESVREGGSPASLEEAAAVVDYTQTNGHSPTSLQPVV